MNHIDDCQYAWSNRVLVDELEYAWKQTFKCTITHEPRDYLSTVIEYQRAAKIMYLSQAHKIQGLLKMTGMAESNSVATPACPSLERKSELEDLPRKQDQGYMAAVGKLIYIATMRPDIAYAVNTRCRRMSASDANDDLHVKRLLRYLRGTTNKRLKFDANVKEPSRLFCLADSSFADAPGAKSTGSYMLTMGRVEGHCNVICFRSFTQRMPAESSAEAELISVHEAAKAVQWGRNLLSELGLPQTEPTIIYTDNNAVIDGLKTPDKARTRHYRRRQWKLRYLMMHRVIALAKIDTKDNVSDLGTKALGKAKHEHFCSKFLYD
jgi:hypothetical protein